jgi:UDP-GlcNAc:undecaprenyl-phosphate/decaprenyl-phosphate GlcNAc-1-phosphate transferase
MSLILITLISFLLSFALTPLAIKFAKKYSLVDNPRKRVKTTQTHKGTIPRAGGLSIGITIIIAILVFIPLTKVAIGVLLAILLTVIIGVIDDAKESNPYLRFIANIIIAGIIVGAGAGIPFITNPFNGVFHLDTISLSFSFFNYDFSILPLADIAALVWIVWAMNIIGWSGGVDGQLPGFVTIAAIVIGILSFRFSAHDISQHQVAALSFITAGAFAGFLPWNFYPQKIMPGYGGKSLAGLLLATLSILSGAKLGAALLVLSIPMTDAAFTLLRRLASGKSPFWADKGHLHHKLLERGWGKRRIAIFYWLTTAIFGLVALSLTSTYDKFFAAALIITLILMALTWLHYSVFSA